MGDLEVDAGAAWVHGVEGNPLIEDGWIRPEDTGFSLRYLVIFGLVSGSGVWCISIHTLKNIIIYQVHDQ